MSRWGPRIWMAIALSLVAFGSAGNCLELQTLRARDAGGKYPGIARGEALEGVTWFRPDPLTGPSLRAFTPTSRETTIFRFYRAARVPNLRASPSVIGPAVPT